MVLYCAADLLWATRIKGTADSLGIPCRPVRNVDMFQARLVDSDVTAMIVDLEAGLGEAGETAEGGDIALNLIQAARQSGQPEGQTAGQPAGHPIVGKRPITILAFGPHVLVDRFDQARAAGADQVLPRGAFDRRLPEILKMLAGPAS